MDCHNRHTSFRNISKELFNVDEGKVYLNTAPLIVTDNQCEVLLMNSDAVMHRHNGFVVTFEGLVASLRNLRKYRKF